MRRGEGWWVGGGGGAFIQLFSSSLLTAHPEPGSYSLLKPQMINQVCGHISNSNNIHVQCAFLQIFIQITCVCVSLFAGL